MQTITCPAGFTQKNNKCVAPVISYNCPEGEKMFSRGKSCLWCPPGMTNNGSSCSHPTIKCPNRGEVPDADGKCVPVQPMCTQKGTGYMAAPMPKGCTNNSQTQTCPPSSSYNSNDDKCVYSPV
jgi:hypothetical protein